MDSCQAGKSCATNLLGCLEFGTRIVDEVQNMDIVFLDFAKAFDKVPKERLLVKLAAVESAERSSSG